MIDFLAYEIPNANKVELIVIKGRPISKKNSRRNFKNVSLPSVAYQTFEADALKQLEKYRCKFEGLVHVKYVFHIKGRYRVDVDNLVAGVNDVLEKAGIISNDNNIDAIEARKINGAKDWLTEIVIESY